MKVRMGGGGEGAIGGDFFVRVVRRGRVGSWGGAKEGGGVRNIIVPFHYMSH
jgi:hypothetical protein